MSKLAGRFTQILFAGYDLSSRANQFEANIEYGEVDGTAFLDSDENSYPGMPLGLANVTAFMDPDTASSHAALSTPGGYTDKVLMILIGQNAAPVIGDPVFCLACKQFKYSPKVTVTGGVMADSTFRNAGKRPDLGKVLANTSITNTTNFASVNEGAATTAGYAGYLEVTTPVASDVYAIKLQHSTNDSTWVDLATFTANGQTRTSERIEGTGTVNQYRRAVATRSSGVGQTLGLTIGIAT